jgi:NADH:ubiquinone reductase (H+-translocating)
MKRVIIIGMGFGGIRAAKAFAGADFDVLVLDRRNFHLFQPLLYQVATSTLEQEAIAYPIRSIVREWPGVRFQMSEVRGIDLQQRQVITADTADGPIPYDYLILAAGSVTNFFGLESIMRHAHDLKQLQDAVALRNHILSAFERASRETDPVQREALMTFVVVGGGPTGVEFSGALTELAHHMLVKDYPGLPVQRSRIILVEALDRILMPFPERLRRYALRRLKRMGVEVRLGVSVKEAQPDRVLLGDGTEIRTHTLFWAAGVRASPLADAIPVPKERGGRIPVQPDLSLKDHPEVFVIGDMAHLEQDGTPLPMLAPVAMQQGEYAARAIILREQGQSPAPFRYWDKGFMAVIGRNAAVAVAKGIKLQGFIAWLAWLGLHLYFLIGWRNRAITLLNWGYDYLFQNRRVRLITYQPSNSDNKKW